MRNQYTPSIKRAITRIDVDEKIAFAYPFAVSNYYKSIAKEILENQIPNRSRAAGYND